MRSFYKTSLFCLASCAFSTLLTAQLKPGCDGSRYTTEVSATTKKTTVTFAQDVVNHTGQKIDLKMDVYEPVGDVFTARPVMVLVHGGSFVTGTRADISIVNYCKEFAKRGYVTATIDYRLYPVFVLGFPDSLDVMDTAIKAVGDLKSSVRWFREDAAATNQFHVDPSQILVGGYSAGAVTALHAVYLDDADSIPGFVQSAITTNGGLNGTTGSATNQAQSNALAACVNLSGGLYIKEWINVGEVPMASFHGEKDDVVPFLSGIAAGVMTLQGSGLLHPQAEAVGVETYLKAAPLGDHYNIHDAATTLPERAQFFTEASLFLFEKVLCPGVLDLPEIPISTFLPKLMMLPNPAQNSTTISIPRDEKGWTIEVFDPLGRLVEKVQNAPNSLIFNALSTGVFTVRASNADGRREVRRVVFQ